jgi:Gpi18-like mannosyltransferase
MGFFKHLSKQKKVLIEILIILIITRVLILVVGYLSNLVFIGEIKLLNYQSVLDLFFRWDSYWYIEIVEYGYSYFPGELSSVAFFPLYPLFVKIFSFLFGNPKLVGFIISNAALFLACFYLYKLTNLEFRNKSIAMKAVFFMLIAPVSFFFSIIYTEGLFLFLAISCFYYMRKKQWLTASILGFFLSLTRSVGFIIFFPMLMEYLDLDFYNFKIRKEKIKKDILYLLLVPAGLLSYMAYLYVKFGNPFVFYTVQATGSWLRKFTSVFFTLHTIIYCPFLYAMIFAGSIVLAILLITYLYFSEARLSYTIYSLLLLGAYLSTGNLASIQRFIGVIFPLYISLALIANKNKYLRNLLEIFFIILLIFFIFLFVNNYYFY